MEVRLESVQEALRLGTRQEGGHQRAAKVHHYLKDPKVRGLPNHLPSWHRSPISPEAASAESYPTLFDTQLEANRAKASFDITVTMTKINTCKLLQESNADLSAGSSPLLAEEIPQSPFQRTLLRPSSYHVRPSQQRATR